MELIEDKIIKKEIKYKVDNVDNKYYIEAIKNIDQTVYETSRYFKKERGQMYMILKIQLKGDEYART